MIIMMSRNYNTIHIGEDVYHDVSEPTWRFCCWFIRWMQDEHRAVSLMCQTGWSIKVKEVSNVDKKQYSLLIRGDIAFVHEFDHIPVPTEFPGFLWSMAGDTEAVVVDAATQERYVNPLARGLFNA